MMARLVLAVVALLAASLPAVAQSNCSNIRQGAVLTPGQWNQCFAAKQDALGFVPLPGTGAARSVLGVPGNATGAVVSIQASAADQVMRATGAGTGIGWGSLDLSKSGAVGSSILGAANGGLGASASSATGVPVFATGTVSFVATMGSGNIARASGSTFTASAFNGTVGATTPSTISATTGSYSGDVTSVTSHALNNGSVIANWQLNGSGDPILNVVSAKGLELRTTNAIRQYITAGGDIGFGTTTPIVTTGGTLRFFTLSADVLGANAISFVSIGGNITGTAAPAGVLAFYNSAIGAADKRIAQIFSSTDGATNSGNLQFTTYNAGTPTTWASLNRLGLLTHTGTLKLTGIPTATTPGCVTNDAAGLISGGGLCGGGVPNGGVLGNVLVKKSGTNGDFGLFPAPALNLAAAASAASLGDCTAGAIVVVPSTLIGTAVNAYVPPGCTLQVSADDTIAATKTFTVSCGGQIIVDTTKTLTINANWIDPGVCATPIFAPAGTGKVVGISTARPRYWTCNGNAGAFDVACIQNAFTAVAAASAATASERVVLLGCTTYYINATVTYTLAAAATPKIKGCGSLTNAATTIMAKSSFTGTSAIVIGMTGQCCVNFELSNFSVVNEAAAGGPANGLNIGDTGGGSSNISSFQHSLIDNVAVSGFTSQFYIHDIRQITLNNVLGMTIDSVGTETASAGCFALDVKAGSFTGDMDFVRSQCVGNFGAGTPTGIGASLLTTTSGRVSGIRFSGSIFYGSAIQMRLDSTSTGWVSDIYVGGFSQFEGPSPGTSIAIQTIANGGAKNGHTIFEGNYLSGNGFNTHFYMAGSAGATLEEVGIVNNFIANPNGGFACIYFNNGGATFLGVTVASNRITNISAGGAAQPVISITGTTRLAVTGNIAFATAPTGRPNFVAVLTSSEGTVSANASGGHFASRAVDLTGSSTIDVTGANN